MAARLYGVFWRWHFLAGMIAFPIVFVVALTGAVYTFQPELDRATRSELLLVEPGPARRSLDELVGVALAACKSRGLLLPHEDERSVLAYCDDDREVYVDPYRGHVLGARDVHTSFFGVVFDLHWDLLLGDPGRLVIEWATTLVLVLALSGTVLWWPRGRRREGGVWWPRRGLRARQRLRDLHAVGGAYVLPVLLALTATGLTFTLHAGHERWRPLTTDVVSRTWASPPRSTVVDGRPRIGYEAALAAAGIALAESELAVYAEIPVRVDDAYAFLVYDDSFASVTGGRSVWIDAYTGERLAALGWADRSTLGKLGEASYPIHVGSLLGLPGRIAACVGALALAALAITGPWMWWKRRPRGELGIPPRTRRAPWWLVVAIAVLGWLLPLLGWTLLAILAIELARWLRERAVTAHPSA